MACVRALPMPHADRSAVIDEYGELDRQVSQFEPTRKRHKELQDAIRSWHDSEPADAACSVSGRLYDVIVGMCGEERFLEPKAKAEIFKRLGRARAFQVFSITLKAVEAELGGVVLATLASKARTGSRKLTAVLRKKAA